MTPDEVLEADAQILYRATIEWMRQVEPKKKQFRRVVMLKHLEACQNRHGLEVTEGITRIVIDRIREILGEAKE